MVVDSSVESKILSVELDDIIVGIPVGDVVDTVGIDVGDVGSAVGCPVGDDVGSAVGSAVGCPVGDDVGCPVGDVVDTVGVPV